MLTPFRLSTWDYRLFGPSRSFFPGTMTSADFLQFVVTTHFFQYVYFMRLQDLPGYSHVLSLFTCPIYPKRFRVALGLRLTWEPCPRLEPYMRFLFVRPEVCPLEDLLTSKIRLSSDSTSRWTPLPLANPSRCRADSGLSPYRTCAHRAHQKELKNTPSWCFSALFALWCR